MQFKSFFIFILALLFSSPGFGQARQIHESLLTIDSHTDTPLWLMRGGIDFMKDNTEIKGSRIDYPRMKKGGLDAAFFAVFTSQGPLTDEGYTRAYSRAEQLFDTLHALTANHSGQIALATDVSSIKKNHRKGIITILIGVENGYPLGLDISRVKHFYERGARYITLSHTKNNQICDSSTDTLFHGGLSEFGKTVVREMNELGMMIDVSHISDSAFDDVIALSTHPVIASHSNARAICNHPRNLTDEMLSKLARNGGVIQVCILSDYVKEPTPNPLRDSVFKALNQKYNQFTNLDDETLKKARAEWTLTDQMYPRVLGTVSDLCDHIDHIVRIAGIDHVGIGTDFDGGGGLADCRDASELPNITAELLRRGYTQKDLRKIWGDNLMRVMEAQKTKRLKNQPRKQL